MTFYANWDYLAEEYTFNYWLQNADDEGYKRLLATCSYFHGVVPVYVALPKEKRSVRLPAEYSIEWSRDVCEILVKEFGIENVSLF